MYRDILLLLLGSTLAAACQPVVAEPVEIANGGAPSGELNSSRMQSVVGIDPYSCDYVTSKLTSPSQSITTIGTDPVSGNQFWSYLVDANGIAYGAVCSGTRRDCHRVYADLPPEAPPAEFTKNASTGAVEGGLYVVC